ncbi:MAG: homoserine dehydrogenase [Beijerinckiaceae bacterium]|nr:homoserine dehydrogenase [Beijerinckiaceae bacterium]MCZ8301462.1 homoserine dehydrogenase [Beijerinckiaceae bacterium]
MADALRIGIAGLGTVGAATIRILTSAHNELSVRAGRPIRIVAVSARTKGRDRGVDLSGYRWHDDPVALAKDPEVDLVVELMGGSDGQAKALVEAALAAGKPVVTANKALLAAHGQSLALAAEAHGTTIAFEAAAAGGIPVIKALREALVGNTMRRVSGILNGTCNYILSRMEAEGLDFQQCLKAAQELGYAEADPTFDIEGYDTAHKLALLTALAFGTEVDGDAVYVEGISGVTPLDLEMAEELGFRIKLLGVAERTAAGIEQRVHPTMVSRSSQLAGVMGVTNAVSIDADPVGTITLVGPGAGGGATASAVVGDIVDLARGNQVAMFGRPSRELDKPIRAPMQRHEGGYYIRLQVMDRPGAAAIIATRMAERGISLESILQKGRDARRNANGSVPVILITYATTELLIRNAVAAIAEDGVLDGPPQVIRIER